MATFRFLKPVAKAKPDPLVHIQKGTSPHEGRYQTLHGRDSRLLTCYTDRLPILGAFRNQDTLRHDLTALNYLLKISNWTSDVRHVQGAMNPVADALSRPGDDLPASYGQAPGVSSIPSGPPCERDVLL